MASFTALTVAAAVALRRRPRPSRYVLCGLLAALAVASLHNGIAVLLPLLAAHLLRKRDAASASRAWALVPLALVAAALPVFYPFQFRSAGPGAGLQVEERGQESVLDLSGHFVALEQFDGGGFAEVLGGLVSYDPVLSLLGALGLAAAAIGWARRRTAGPRGRDVAVLAAYAVPYLLVIGAYGKSAERFALPLIPFVACLAAYAVARLPGPGGLRLAVGALALGASAVLAWKMGAVRAAPDTYARTASWALEHVDPGERMIAVLDPFQDLPLARTEEALAAGADWKWTSPWFRYQARLPAAIPGARDLRVASGVRPAQLERDPLGALRGLGARWVVVELTPGGGMRSSTQRAVREALLAKAERVHRESPMAQDDGGAQRVFVRQVSWRPLVVLHWLAARCTGPTLEVYRLP